MARQELTADERIVLEIVEILKKSPCPPSEFRDLRIGPDGHGRGPGDKMTLPVLLTIVQKWHEGLVLWSQRVQADTDELEAYRNVVSGLAFLQATVLAETKPKKSFTPTQLTSKLVDSFAFLASKVNETCQKRGWRTLDKPD